MAEILAQVRQILHSRESGRDRDKRGNLKCHNEGYFAAGHLETTLVGRRVLHRTVARTWPPECGSTSERGRQEIPTKDRGPSGKNVFILAA